LNIETKATIKRYGLINVDVVNTIIFLAILAVKYNDQFFEAISIFGVSTLVYFSTCIAVIHSRRSQKIKKCNLTDQNAISTFILSALCSILSQL